MMTNTLRALFSVAAIATCSVASAAQAQAPAGKPAANPQAPAPTRPSQAPPVVAAAVIPPDYVIGVEDVLVIVFWREKDISSEVVVRPDGKITLPLINDVVASGLTPDQLRDVLAKEAERFIEEPAPSVVVKQINSRKVYITGEISKPGPYPLTGPTTILQLIAIAGGLREFAQKKDIVIMRNEGGKAITFQFNYAEVANRKKLQQNILLKPGDTIVVP